MTACAFVHRDRPRPPPWRAALLCGLVMACLGATLLAGAARAADLSIHVIQRTDAEALVPVVRPLLPEGGSVNAYQGKLIIQTTANNFDEILAALGDMPDAPRTLSVTLRRRGESESQGGGVRVGGGGVSVSSSERRTQRQDEYRVNTLSGHAAGISQGALVSLTGTQYPALMALKQGIQVTPTLTGDGQVRLSIAQRFDESAGGGRARTQGASSTLMLTPGEWEPLGEIRVSEQQDRRALDGAGGSSQTYTLPLDVKVEMAR